MNNLPAFDADTDDSEDDYWTFVNALEDLAVAELLRAGDDAEQQKQAIRRYFQRGIEAHLNLCELWEYLGPGFGETGGKCKRAVDFEPKNRME